MLYFSLNDLQARPWIRVFRSNTNLQAIDLVSLVLVYSPHQRPSPLEACAHSFFDVLRSPGTKLPNGRDILPCTDFACEELCCDSAIASLLCGTQVCFQRYMRILMKIYRQGSKDLLFFKQLTLLLAVRDAATIFLIWN